MLQSWSQFSFLDDIASVAVAVDAATASANAATVASTATASSPELRTAFSLLTSMEWARACSAS